MRTLLLTTALLLMPAHGLAQDVLTEDLGQARAFAPGIDVPGALDAAAWQGTSAATATRLLMGIEPPDSAASRALLRRVVLAGLSPPDGADDAFETARIRAARLLAQPGEYERFAARNSSTNDPKARADAALLAGDLLAACKISDALVTGRGDSHWVRLRAACHEQRGETAAAELARELLIERREETELTIAKPTDPFWSRVARDEVATLSPYLSDLALKDVELSEVDPVQGISFDLETAAADDSPTGYAQLYQLALGGDAKAAALFVKRGRTAGQDPDWLLARLPATLDPSQMAAADLPLFARHAAATRNIPLMQALFGASDAEGDKTRLALASDALGGGFFGRDLGQGLEGALDSQQGRDDALIALALGAHSSDALEQALIKLPAAATDWVFIDAALLRGARAEAALRIADVLATNPTVRDRYHAIRALTQLGQSEVAGQLAAEHFLQGL